MPDGFRPIGPLIEPILRCIYEFLLVPYVCFSVVWIYRFIGILEVFINYIFAFGRTLAVRT